MTSLLRLAIVLSATEQAGTVFADGREEVIAFADFFPAPRVERVTPGHLVAVATGLDANDVIVWRWFDAVVIGVDGSSVRLWEPLHGPVLAQPRSPEHGHQPGSRAYLSAGLPGADWWVAGPVAGRAEDADVELADVARFLDEHSGRS